MITIEWHLLAYIVFNLVVLIWAISRDNYDKYFGSDRFWALILFIILAIMSTLLYGGIYWW